MTKKLTSFAKWDQDKVLFAIFYGLLIIMKLIHSNLEFLETFLHKKQPQFLKRSSLFQLTVSELLNDKRHQYTIKGK